jgi:hypothetical protein
MEDLRACVYMYEKGSEVEIINDYDFKFKFDLE